MVEREYMSMLGAVNLAGLIFVSGSTRTVENGLQDLPAIYIDRAPEMGNKDALVIESDNYGGARLAVQELYEKGCRRIACIHSAKVISTYSFRYSGYCDQLALYGLSLIHIWSKTPVTNVAGAEKADHTPWSSATCTFQK